ncbi:glycosyltransferase family 8 protein [Hortaea werneckii]|nr:glycosyltransferase family 8 protein [Hortaea werneckii]KAI7325522.1 glycosyltransferase family 8 protein [Hortaea werneckii]
MRRILLSQSQVSLFASSAVVFIFTLLLFLSGYVIQQRTVKGLQVAIKPRIPSPPPSLQLQQKDEGPQLRPSRHFRASDKVAFTNLDAVQQQRDSIDWTRLAHVQLARNHHDVCNAVMVLADLHRLKSPARRVLMFPEDWALDQQGKKHDMSDPFLASSKRLLRMAARRYGVELRPVSPALRANNELDGSSNVYSLASAFALKDFDRVLSIESPGLIIDALPLDAVLAFTENTPFAMLQDSHDGDGVHSADLLLLKPSASSHAELLERLGMESNFNDSIIPTLFTDPLLLASKTDDHTLIRSIGLLHQAAQDFNATAYLDRVSYIRFSDPKLPGPEYDVPWPQKVAARPSNKDADWTWTKLYGEFAQKRMDVCGLDLETWRA